MEKINIRQLFFQFHVKLAITFALICMVGIICFRMLIDNNLVTHKYSNEQINEKIKNLQSEDNFSIDNYSYIEIDNSEITSSNMDKLDQKNAFNYFKYGRQTRNIVHSAVQKNEKTYIIQFPTEYLFVNDELRDNFRNPVQLLIGIGLIIFILMYYYISKSMYLKFDINFASLMHIVNKINDDNLDFNDENSDFMEFVVIKKAIAGMKQNLITSKKEIWNQNNSMKKQIAALSHDIKVPISIIRGNSELMESNLYSEKNNKRLKSIIRQVDRIDKFLVEFSTFAKLQCLEKIQLTSVELQDFCNLIEQSTEDLCLINKREFRFKQINIKDEYHCNINQVYMLRAIINILRNALDYSDKMIIVLIQRYKNFIKINIIDFGEGFNDDQMRHCKDLFYSKNINRTGEEHYGIGLSFADKVVELHGGSLIVHSDIGKYSMITISLPISK